MYYENYNAKIMSIIPRKVEKNETIREFCSLTLAYEFTEQFAQGMGPFEESLQGALSEGRLYSARLPVPKEEIVANFSDGGSDALTVRRIDTAIAALRRPNAEDPSPTLSIAMQFPADNEQFIWLKDRLNQTVTVNLDKVQGDLFEAAKGGKKGRKNG